MIADEIAKNIHSKNVKEAIFILGGAIVVMTAINYYYQIKITKMRMKQMKFENPNL